MKESEVFIFRIEICIVLRDVHWYYCPAFLTHFMPLISFPWKHQKTIGFLIFSRAVEKKTVTWNRSMLYIDGCPDNYPRGKLTLVRNRVWFRVRVRIRDRGNFPRRSIFLKPYRRILPRKKQPPELFYKKGVSLKFNKIHRKKPVPGPHF